MVDYRSNFNQLFFLFRSASGNSMHPVGSMGGSGMGSRQIQYPGQDRPSPAQTLPNNSTTASMNSLQLV